MLTCPLKPAILVLIFESKRPAVLGSWEKRSTQMQAEARRSFIRAILQMAAKTRMASPDKAQRPIGTLADADARGGGNLEVGFVAPVPDGERTSVETRAVLCTRDGEGTGEF